MKNWKIFISLLLVVIINVTSVYTITYASDISQNTDIEVVNDYEVSKDVDTVRETLSVIDIDGSLVTVIRESYPDNTYALSIIKNGEITKSTGTIHYEAASMFINESNDKSRGVSYTYRYLGSVEYTDKISPQNGTYSIILAAVSYALSSYSLPLSAISAIASAWAGLYAGPFDMWVVTKKYTYEIYNSDGTVFMGSYRMNYYENTYSNSSCTGTPIYTTNGYYENNTPG